MTTYKELADYLDGLATGEFGTTHPKLANAAAILRRLDAPVAAQPQPSELEAMRQRKDGAYFERNQVVAALAKCFPSGVAKTAIDGWSEDWHGCVYIDLPTGQVSWHFHDSQAYLFKDLPSYAGAWDGHDTPEKYRRVNALAAAQPTREQAQRGRMATQWDAKAFDFSRYFAALQRAMRARNASAADVSRATGVSNTTLTRMKEGRRPDATSLAALSAWAGLNPAEYVRASPATKDFDLPAQSDEVAAQASKPLSDAEIFDLAEPFGAFEFGDAQGNKRLDFASAAITAFCLKNGIKERG